MLKLSTDELRRKYIEFFVQKHAHKAIQGASVIPENDPTVLFTTAGMHPLVPYLLGEKHPEGVRLVDVQKCIRTGDIDEVGDNSHLTCFEMLGNWSLGDYFKKESIQMSYEFLTEVLQIDPDSLAVTVFAGDADAPRDEIAIAAWEALGFVQADKAAPGQNRRIFAYGKKDNWWGPAGLTGPCGPDTEIFFYVSDDLEHKWDWQPSDSGGPWLEIWNNVFMEFNKTEEGTYEPLTQKNVDTGMGLERTVAVLNGKNNVYDLDIFTAAMAHIRGLVSNSNQQSERVVADHIRAATFILGDDRGITPSNNDQGYVLRKLIRRAIRHGRKLGIEGSFTASLAKVFIETYGDVYPEFRRNEQRVIEALNKEEDQFLTALENGEYEIGKDIGNVNEALIALSRDGTVVIMEIALNAVSHTIANVDALKVFNEALRPIIGKLRGQLKAEAAHEKIPATTEVREMAAKLQNEGWILRGERAFHYFEAFGFPLEMTQEIMAEKNVKVDAEGYETAMKAHQEKSRAGAEQKFAGGLADHSMESKKLHTATHLMLEALRRVLGKHVEQRGSNITQERLRFDFNHTDKMTPEQIAEVEKIVNDAIQEDYPVSWKEMSVEEAKALDATGIFIDKYEHDLGGKVKVYFMGDYSKEICGGPHVDHTGQLGSHFKIVKEESSSSGIRRIKAVLEA